MSEKSEDSVRAKRIRIYRLSICIIAWTGIFIRIIVGIFDVAGGQDPIAYFGNQLSFYTFQTNIMVAIWLTTAVILGKKKGKNEKEIISVFMHPIVHGAICLYITMTFLIFAIFLSGGYRPTGLEAISNILMHYVVPISFILEWVVSEMHTEYKYRYLLHYSIYPFAYVIYTVIRGLITGFYPYYFFDLNQISPLSLLIVVFVLVVFYSIIGGIYIAINRKLYKSEKQ